MTSTGTYRPRRPRNRARLAVAAGLCVATAAGTALAALVGAGAAGVGVRPVQAPCLDTAVVGTVEEERLGRSVPGQTTPVGLEIVRRGGFDAVVAAFGAALCEVPGAAAATATVDRFGRQLWRAAVARAQGPEPTRPDALPASDDRPLYWARLAMARELRQWRPSFPATGADRDGWQHSFEAASRGLTTSDFAPVPGVRRLFVSGFDPFGLDAEIRRGNPSGAAVLRLDGRVLTAGTSRVQVQVVVLPVRYADFDGGIVEDAFEPHVPAGAQGADMFTTISQGRPGRFDLEMFNGRRRSTTAVDNLGVQGGGQISDPIVFPGVGPGPEFIRSTLPLEAMRAGAAAGAFPTMINTQVVEIPAGSTGPVLRPDGPTPGSIAVEGGGGGYLSNESAYRATRLLLAAGTALPGGHLHTPVLDFGVGNGTEITDPTFEANRTAIVTEVQQILLAGVAAIG